MLAAEVVRVAVVMKLLLKSKLCILVLENNCCFESTCKLRIFVKDLTYIGCSVMQNDLHLTRSANLETTLV